ncbi:O-antigen ligase family protein [Salinibacter ruber]|uniref:O-antigen ligase family protein n=1 Tax=Salinibacter ruber TaxID=146919 RepID=UPI00207398D5|nr:O-antigen ligase family protein [Salinibacter ruber]
MFGALVFASVLGMVLAQAQSQQLESFLYLGRWIPLGLLTVYALFLGASSPRLRGPAIRRFRGIDGWIMGWIAMAYVSAGYSIAPGTTLLMSTTFILGYGAVFWGVWSYVDRFGERPVITMILSIAGLIAVASLASFFTGIGSAADLGYAVQDGGIVQSVRLRGVLENPNSLGMLCAFTLPLFLVRAMTRKSIFTYGVFGIVVITALFTGSRGSLGASILGCGYMIWKSKHVGRVGAVFFALLTVAVGLYGLRGTIESVILRPEQLETASGRFLIWELFAEYIRNRPLLGHGWGTEDLLHNHYGTNLEQLGIRGIYAGSSYVGFAGQVGVLMTAAFFLPLFWLTGRNALVPRGAGIRLHALNAVLIVGLTTAAVESWMSSLGNAQSLLFWIPVMLLVRRRVRARTQRRKQVAASRASPRIGRR